MLTYKSVIDEKNNANLTPLGQALLNNHYEVAHFLLCNGTTIYNTNNYYTIPALIETIAPREILSRNITINDLKKGNLANLLFEVFTHSKENGEKLFHNIVKVYYKNFGYFDYNNYEEVIKEIYNVFISNAKYP